ncbi:MAG: LamG domain-containing protein [Bacteroidaceae bacterium]|nr:LamG domain-containing protein [Bacteroidaceae bacterium]
MKRLNSRTERRWQVPLSGRLHGTRLWPVAMLLAVVLAWLPQQARADGDYYAHLQLRDVSYDRNSNGSSPYVSFYMCYYNDYGTDEGYIKDKGGGMTLYASKDGGSSWTKILFLYTSTVSSGTPSAYTETVSGMGCNKDGNPVVYNVGTGIYDDNFSIKIKWVLPLQWRNCNIKIKASGTWIDKDGSNKVSVNKTVDIATPYTFKTRDLLWNTGWSVDTEGNMTVPYKFGDACNTDGETKIWNKIDNSWTNKISAVEFSSSGSYVSGSYTFKLSDIGKSYTTDFKITPYHEFCHTNDKDASNGRKVYTSEAAELKFYKFPVPEITKASFDQEENKLTLIWKESTTNYLTGNHNTKWAIYRNGVYVTSILQDQTGTSYFRGEEYNTYQNGQFVFYDDATEDGFVFDESVEYTVYYIWKEWNEKTAKVSALSATATANTLVTLPVANLSSESKSDRVVLTWTSDAHKKSWGHEYRIYVDDETEPIYTIKPNDDQTDYKWEHRTTDQHTDRQDGVDNGVPYVEEPLNACDPHDYRVVSYVNGLIPSEVTLTKRAIGSGTLFYSFDATKGVYPGMVKLSWHVDLQGNKDAKTYIVERRPAEKDDAPWETVSPGFTSRDDYVNFTDDTPLPGVYYEYRVTVIDNCSDGTQVTNSITNIGFAQTTGTVSGRITFGSSGTSVAGVDVVAKRIGASANTTNQYHAMRFKSTGGVVTWTYPETDYAAGKFNSANFSMQMWISPDELSSALFARFGDNCGLGMDEEGKLFFRNGTESVAFDSLSLTKDAYSQVTLTRSGKTLIGYLTKYGADGIAVLKADTVSFSGNISLGSATDFTLGYFKGYIDEFRLWTKYLTKDEVKENFDHLLVGNETGLETYWTFDEGLSRQFFDTSREGTVYHQHHGVMGSNTETHTYTPSHLALKAKTDTDGNYIIQGVPFSGEGTTYAIVPQLASHEFNPTQQLRFVSNNSLVHNGTDFTDISSFSVSGVIYYSGTTYPVEGVNLYVDGVICTKDGSMIATNADGEFTISVPIGNHYIEVAKNGHVFENNGRYPADPEGTGEKFYFNQKITGLEFRDTTLVNFTGRVVGGDIEGNKPVGFAQSENNIGVTQFFLQAQNTTPFLNAVKKKISDTSFEYVPDSVVTAVSSGCEKINSTSWRGATIDSCRYIYIETDAQTGEFSAMVPPLVYSIGDIVVKNKKGLIVGGNVSVDLSNPLVEASDTLTDDTGDLIYTYNSKLVQAYHSTPVFTVSQKGRTDGSFGIKSYKMKDDTVIDDIYTVKDDGTVAYNYGVDGHKAPLFVGDKTYEFLLEGYEEYTNYDGTSPKTFKVPLQDVVVTIDNALSSEQAVFVVDGEVTYDDGTTATAKAGQVHDLKSNQLQLDEEGKATYKWTAGLPNVSEPYTRTISMSYEINGNPSQWTGSGMEGIVMGDLPTGNNFVTSGPDKLLMILRDPPGTGSSAEWSTGTTTSLTKLVNDTWSESFESGFTSHLGHEIKYISGVVQGAVKVDATSAEISDKDDLTTHVTEENEGEKGETVETSISISEVVATSGESDFVGADGDVFVGQATNVIFGDARHVGFKNTGSGYEISMCNVISTGLSFGTIFNYSQSYIENTLLPNFELLRKSMLTTTTQDSINMYNPTNGYGVHDLGKSKGNLYFTTLKPSDEGYGEDGTYTVIVPNGLQLMPDSITDPIEAQTWALKANVATVDSVKWINNQIRGWKKYLMLNEQEKVKAYELRMKDDPGMEYQNYSFDGGASRSYSWEKDSTYTSSWDWTVSAGLLVGNRLGFEINGTGVDWDLEVTATGGRHEAKDDSKSYSTSFAYTLAEEGEDALTVDVYQYGAFSPIFRTRGGQTSNPYEGEVRTNYYTENNANPVIMEATMQIEAPDLSIDVTTVTDIPTGSAANYTLRLANNSEIGSDVTYRLFFLDETNPDGAQLSIDGKVLTAEGRLIKVPGNQTLTKTLQLRQTDSSILNYEGITDEGKKDKDPLYKKGIGIVFASDSEPEEIADTVFIYAYFTPSASSVDLALSARTLNTQTGDNVTLTFSGFDRNYFNQKAFRLQYLKDGEADWIQLAKGEYVLADSLLKSDNQELPATGATVEYPLSMSGWDDGDYLFRAVSAATYKTGEVYTYSDEIALVKDMQKPRPMGQPEPSDGVLDIGDDVSITFNETFVKGNLSKPNNFTITGVLNGAEIAHETALSVNSGTATAATAQTDASINLAGKDFSIDAWVNITGNGTLLSHGQGTSKLTVGTNADGKLLVTINGQEYTSSNSVPTGEWTFLTMNITADGTLSASAATATETVKLFDGATVDVYSANGPLSVGCGMAAAIHELLLWDEAHDIATALQNRSKSKNPSTRHLIGYWKMDEGEGTSIRDYSRSRHLTMADETWYLNNVNKAVTLDGSHYISINTTTLPITEYDDYAVEFWMRGGEQSGEAQLMQMGEVALSLSADGTLLLTGLNAAIPAERTQITTASGKLNDNAWHHVALNVLRQGAAAVYVDGQRCLTTNADNVGGINGDKLIMGMRRNYDATVGGLDNYTYDLAFTGKIDEVRLWGATMNADLITKNRKVRFTGKEDGLMAYYPFETKTLDSYNQVVTLGTDADLTGSGLTAQLLTSDAAAATLDYADDAPALRTKPAETNVSFSFVASDEQIVIEIDEDPATIEGTTLTFNVRSVRDVNGNYSSPAIWSAFVNCKELEWEEDALSLTQHVEGSSSVTATIVNKGGSQQLWTLAGMPSWLTASSEYGTTNPRSESTVTFTVSPATPIGKYEETIYLKGNNGIETPLTLSVVVTGDEPEWSVNPNDFEYSMNVIGQLNIFGVDSSDPDDIIAAFIGEECRGVAHPEYKQRYDGYYLTMGIYGNDDDKGKSVTFRAYDASTGTLYPEVTPSVAVTYESLSLIGKYETPVVLAVEDKIEQSTDLKAGWNWMSLFVVTDDMDPQTLFAGIADDVLTIKGQSEAEGVLMRSEGVWFGNMVALDNSKMYSVQMAADRNLRLVGSRVNPQQTPVTLANKWNWVGYYGQQLASPVDALSDMQPQDDDILKSQNGVAYYDNYEWSGSIVAMKPGVGYMIYNTAADKQFAYPQSVVSSSRKTAQAMENREAVVQSPVVHQSSVFTPVDYHAFSGNMIVVARIERDGMPVSGAELGVFADEQCRATGVADEGGMLYLIVPGDESIALTFKVAVDGQVFNLQTTSEDMQSTSIDFETDAIYGTPKEPVVFTLGATGIMNMAGSTTGEEVVYDLQGRRINDGRSVILQKGIYVVNGQKVVIK